MKAWKKVLIGGVSALTLAGGANLAAMAAGQDDRPSVVDVKGPCDEAEHANDPECAGPQIREDNGREQERGDDRGREREDRGREAESENEGRDDNSGPSEDSGPSDDSGRDDESGRDDRSGHDDGSGHDAGDDHGNDD
jgi:hypothetical protein